MAFLDNTGLARFWQHILARLGGKVDVEEGKGLSTNDFTNAYKSKITFQPLASGTNLNTITAEGFYGARTTDISNTLGNNPLMGKGSGLLLEVFNIDGLILQRVTGTTVKGIYIRRYSSSSSSWGEWRELETSGDLANSFLPLTGGVISGDTTVEGTLTANVIIGAVYQ